MRIRLLDYLRAHAMVVGIAGLLVTVFVTLTSPFQLNGMIPIVLFASSLCILEYLLVVNPTGLVLMGLLRRRVPDDLSMCVSRTLQKHYPQIDLGSVRLLVIEDAGSCVALVRSVRGVHLVVSSSILSAWHEIDIECAVVYLFERTLRTYPLCDTVFLVLASLAERAIITAVIGGGLAHLVRSPAHDAQIDRHAVDKVKYVKGYTDMLTKLVQSKDTEGVIPSSVSIAGVANLKVKTRGVSTMFTVHQDPEQRIQYLSESYR